MMASLPLSSFGCAVLDPLIAVWLFACAPSPWLQLTKRAWPAP